MPKRKIEIAQSPCLPFYSVIVDGLWDTDCASNSEAVTLEAAREAYPDDEIIMWDDPRHYSQEVDHAEA